MHGFDDGCWLIHAGYIHLIAELMQGDIAHIKHFIKDASLMCLDTRYIVEFCEIGILHKDRPTDIDDASISDDPDIAVPIEHFVEHDKKEHE